MQQKEGHSYKIFIIELVVQFFNLLFFKKIISERKQCASV